jgi:hypothetical protein
MKILMIKQNEMTKNQKSMAEICDELGGGKDDLYLSMYSDYSAISSSIDSKYLSITLQDGDIRINKLNTFDEDLIIQAVRNSSFVGDLRVTTVYTFK